MGNRTITGALKEQIKKPANSELKRLIESMRGKTKEEKAKLHKEYLEAKGEKNTFTTQKQLKKWEK